MAAQTHKVVIDGIHFRFTRFKSSRGFRTKIIAERVLGVPAMYLIGGAVAGETLTEVMAKAKASGQSLESATWLAVRMMARQHGTWSDPSEAELLINALAFEDGCGVELSGTGGNGSWIPFTGLESLDSWVNATEDTPEELVRAFLWWHFRPTMPATGTSSDTSAVMTPKPSESPPQPGNPLQAY